MCDVVTGGKGRRVRGSGEGSPETRSADAAGMVRGMAVNQICCHGGYLLWVLGLWGFSEMVMEIPLPPAHAVVHPAADAWHPALAFSRPEYPATMIHVHVCYLGVPHFSFLTLE